MKANALYAKSGKCPLHQCNNCAIIFDPDKQKREIVDWALRNAEPNDQQFLQKLIEELED